MFARGKNWDPWKNMSQSKQKKKGAAISFLFSRGFFSYAILFIILCLALWGGYKIGSIIFFLLAFFSGTILFYKSGKLFISHSSSSKQDFVSSKGFDAILRDAEDGIIVYSPQFEIFHMNPAAERMFSVSAQKYIGTKIKPEISSHPELRVLMQTIFPSLASSVLQISEANEWPQIVDILIDDPELKFHTTLSRVLDDGGHILFFIKIIKDETREQSILKSKNEFISTAAHQLRTPLTAINWAFENIKTMSKDSFPDIASIADEALNVSERALKITNDLLDVAKIEEGKFGYKFAPCDLVEFSEEIINIFKPTAVQKNISLSLDSSGLKSLEAPKIDRERLGMALFNIIDNAIKYTLPNGTVKVKISRDDRYAYIDVSDSGVGIEQKDIKNLFKKFFRGSNVEQLEPNGNGLGLFITKNIIERHGGKISVTSQINRGTVFHFSIPLKSEFVPEFERVVTYQEEL